MLIAGAPDVYIATKAGRKRYEAGKEMTKLNRKAEYLSGVMKSREAVEERAIFGYSGELNRRYSDTFNTARKYRLKVNRANEINGLAGSIAMSLDCCISPAAAKRGSPCRVTPARVAINRATTESPRRS